MLVVCGFASFVIIDYMKRRYPVIDAPAMRRLYFFHLVLSFAYYGYILFNPSDSKAYFRKVDLNMRGDSWFDYYGTSTTFIEFLAYPLIKYFGLSYEACMALFSFFGFLGFIYFYIFFRENLKFKHTFMGYDLLTLTFFLPNLHFWSASLGKGSVILLGIALFFFGISNIRKRFVAIAIGGLIIYHVRPHIMLVILVSTAIGFMFSSRNVPIAWRVLFLACCGVVFFFIYRDVLALVGVNEDEVLSQGLDLTHRATELTKATSGVDITHYSMPMQVFTFLYRPLFVDAPGLLGLIVSFENVFCLIITARFLFHRNGLSYLFGGGFLSKSAFLSFITVSIALAQISGNLGLAMRQKSQIMMLLMFVILSFLDSEKLKIWRREQLRKQRLAYLQPRTPAVDAAKG